MELISLVQDLRSGALGSSDAVRACLARIDDVNPGLNAVVARDDAAALDRAEALDRAFARSGPVGPLHGVPVTVKDWIDVTGLPCAGVGDDPTRRPAADATAVARLRAAGAVVVAKTNVGVDHRLYGPCHHPLDPARSPGGSSSGEAAIVGAGASSLGLGSDSGGSIRLPAAWCSVVGLRPTFGRVPATGHFPRVGGWHDGRTVIGPLTGSVAAGWLALTVIAGPDGLDATAAPVPLGDPCAVAIEGLRIAVSADGGPTEPVERAADALLDAGAVTAGAPPPTYLDEAMDITQRYWHRDELTGGEVDALLWDWDRYRRRMLAAAADFDVLLSPVVPAPAPLARPMEDADYALTLPAALCGWPALSVPLGAAEDGLPLAVQVTGRAWEDHVAVAGAVVEAAARAAGRQGVR